MQCQLQCSGLPHTEPAATAQRAAGVKELFEKEAPKVVRRTRGQMHKAIDPDYYGFR